MNQKPRPYGTFRATVMVTPVSEIGTYSECEAKCNGLIGKEVWVKDAAGENRVIGVIQRTMIENISGY